jgi:hypothetical protein
MAQGTQGNGTFQILGVEAVLALTYAAGNPASVSGPIIAGQSNFFSGHRNSPSQGLKRTGAEPNIFNTQSWFIEDIGRSDLLEREGVSAV